MASPLFGSTATVLSIFTIVAVIFVGSWQPWPLSVAQGDFGVWLDQTLDFCRS